MHTALVRHVTQVHRDDIHGFWVYSSGFVSASKDGSIKTFDFNGKELAVLAAPPGYQEGKLDYRQWVTALHGFDDDSCVAGYRNSYLISKHTCHMTNYYQGLFSKQIDAQFASTAQTESSHASCYKERNQVRITAVRCIKSLIPRYRAWIGTPEYFYEFDFDQRAIVSRYRFDQPEWVYGFAQVDEKSMAAIHGGHLSFFKKQKAEWKLKDRLITEAPVPAGAQRPFISSVEMFPNSSKQELVLSFFGGATKVLDIEAKKITYENRGHSKRVWQSLPLSAYEYASCADDGLVKIWDRRNSANRAVGQVSGHPGRVSALAILPNGQLLAGSCPDRPHEDQHKAQFFFYDVRKLHDAAQNPVDQLTNSFARAKLQK